MYTTLKIYGQILEVTQYEKKSKAKDVRLHCSRSTSFVIGKRRVDSLRRAKQACVRKLSSAIEELGSPILVTLTYDGEATEVYSCSKAVTSFFTRLRVRYPQSHALLVPEISPRGRLHWHGLLFGVPKELGDIRVGGRTVQYGSERATRVLQKCWRVGFLDCCQTDGSPKLAYYLTKYILKNDNTGFSVLLNGLRLLRCTVGFPRELVLRDSDFFVQKVLQKYESCVPLHVWSGETRFTGVIHKTKYQRLV